MLIYDESLCMISAKFSCCILMIDRYFPHAMKMYTIQGSPKVHHFALKLLASRNSNERDVCDLDGQIDQNAS
jgi:hypothetical protein